MIIVRLSGGLGNQMFQYAFGRALALRNKAELKLDLSNYKSTNDTRKYLLDKFVLTVPVASLRERYFKKRVTEPNNKFWPEVMTMKKGLFKGNWQSEKYFADFSDVIRKDFTLESQAAAFKANSVSLHIRRGDYLSDKRTKEKHGLLPVEYYNQAVKLITEKVKTPHFYIFSDDIEWVKAELKIPSLPENITYISGMGHTEVEELALMSKCDHHIIANSSYSWWGAWLNPKKSKIVIAPKQWYKTTADTRDLIPASWIRM